jgi:hypothetical protein
MSKNILKYCFFVLSTLLIAGCSPGTSEVNKALQKKYERIPEVKISSVTKTNGMELKNGSYGVEFNYKVTFISDPEKLRIKLKNGKRDLYEIIDETRLDYLKHFCGSDFRENGECHLSGEMSFRKTENGWME